MVSDVRDSSTECYGDPLFNTREYEAGGAKLAYSGGGYAGSWVFDQ